MVEDSQLAGTCLGSWSCEAVECSICKIAQECEQKTRLQFQMKHLKPLSQVVVKEKKRLNKRRYLTLPKSFDKFRDAIMLLPHVHEERGATVLKYHCGASRFLTVMSPVSEKQIIVRLHACVIDDFKIRPGILYDKDPSFPNVVFVFPNAENWRAELAAIKQLHNRFISSGYLLSRQANRRKDIKKTRIAVADETIAGTNNSTSLDETAEGGTPQCQVEQESSLSSGD